MVASAPRVFADTSAWYALFVATDPRHSQAASVYERLRSSGAVWSTTDWVLIETAALLHRRVGAIPASEVLNSLMNNTQISVLWMDETLGRLALERFQSLRGKASLVDCGSFLAMERLRLKTAFAFDQDFTDQGFTLET